MPVVAWAAPEDNARVAEVRAGGSSVTAYVLAIDQGTTSTRALVYDGTGRPVADAARALTQHYPRPGWVEHDPAEIWQSAAAVATEALHAGGIDAGQVAAVGITNQRETVLLWERQTGRPVTPAVVWQDRRTTDFCRQRHMDETWIHQRTGLVLDPYFSASKVRWLLEQDAGLRARAEAGQLAAGTIDSWLVWNLTAGRAHVTDRTNASRTLLLNLHTAGWDEDLCRYFCVPRALLPQVLPSAADFGRTSGLGFLPDGVLVAGMAGDQQAALFGQCGFTAGDAKCTYGTGAFFLEHVGERPVLSQHRLLTSLAATADDRRGYVLEGSVFVAGAAVQWLRDGLKLFDASPEVEGLAERSDLEEPVLFVPALVGLGAPHWVPEARGVLFGLTRGTTAAELGRAALEGVAFQVADLIDAAARDTGQALASLRVDGGMAANAWFLQRQADVLGLPVLASAHSEATALGAAFLAGLHVGFWPNLDGLRQLVAGGRRFTPRWPTEERQRRLAEWRRAVQTVIAFYTDQR
jgi:glycerol kinase